uniref:Uncharacterized protein n=1 Tax=Nothobranchius furzeri TaxID=105023 RepID=A0A8C6NS19_NOTFU
MERSCSYGGRFWSGWTVTSCLREAARKVCVPGEKGQLQSGLHAPEFWRRTGPGEMEGCSQSPSPRSAQCAAVYICPSQWLQPVRSNLGRVLCDDSVAFIDVCHSLDQPAVSNSHRGEMKGVMEDLLLLLKQHEEAEKPLYVEKKSEEWNLCTVFGVLLGFPVTYWFDQTESFENCLSMTPLMVRTASASWQAHGPHHRCCLYSFTLPAALQEETRPKLEEWEFGLQGRFKQQRILKNLRIKPQSLCHQSVCDAGKSLF